MQQYCHACVKDLHVKHRLKYVDVQVKYEKKMKMVRDDLELRRKQEIHEIEERKVGR
jgi:polyhydroxyalkanoate synthesis regulator phasin